jgi:hypothetical protein
VADGKEFIKRWRSFHRTGMVSTHRGKSEACLNEDKEENDK